MGLKDDIYKAFEKNLGKDLLDSTIEGQKKVDELAEDLSKAVIAFITAQTFRVDKLSMTTDEAKTKPVSPLTGITTIGAPSPHSVNPIPLPVRDVSTFTMGVDKNGGQGGNPINGGELQSNISEVRLRPDEVDER